MNKLNIKQTYTTIFTKKIFTKKIFTKKIFTKKKGIWEIVLAIRIALHGL